MMLEKNHEEKDIKSIKTHKQYKQAFRSGIPDKNRREALLQLFNLNPMTCETRYSTIVKMAGDDFIEHTKRAQMAQKTLEYHCLNQKGLEELEIILALLFKERHIKHSPMMIPVCSLLLIYLKPAEVYHLMAELIT